MLCAGCRDATGPILLDRGLGVVMGTLFSRDACSGSAKRLRTLNPDITRRVAQTQGRELVEAYWGRYVAFLHDPVEQCTRVIRDPTGGIECLRTEIDGINVLFSAFSVPVLEGMIWEVNWQHLVALITRSVRDTRECGVKNVTRIMGGECVRFSNQDKQESIFYWNPYVVVAAREIRKLDDAIELVRRTTQFVVSAWASCYTDIVHMQSGGLDSSIVLGCLRSLRSQVNILCVCSYWPGEPRSDERRLARMAARAAGLTLLENELESEFDAQKVLTMERCPSPYDFLSLAAVTEGVWRVARERGAQAVCNGSNGDEVFFTGALRYACADTIYRKEFKAGLLAAAVNCAQFERRSVWRVLRHAWQAAVRRDELGHIERVVSFPPVLTPRAAHLGLGTGAYRHPWFAERAKCPPGKLRQMLALSKTREYVAPLSRSGDPEMIYPLHSQPLIDLCLQIPTAMLCAGGMDRAVARRAFAAEVPREILARREKGTLQGYIRQLFRANFRAIQEILLDGQLVKEQILDRTILEQALRDAFGSGGAYAGLCCTLFSFEAWLGLWVRSPRVSVRF